MATDRQASFLADLIADRISDPDERRRWQAIDTATLATWEASRLIDDLLARPKGRATTSALGPSVPEGRYAIDREGVTKFYRVEHGDPAGRWAGYVFVSVQASDDLYRVKNAAERAAILTAIAADPTAAARRYGVLLGHCGRCGRTLTDATSRAYGIGPDCREAMGITDAPPARPTTPPAYEYADALPF